MSDKENIIKLFNFLNEKELNVKLSNLSPDGRVNSIINEDVVKNFLKVFCSENSLKYESGKERAWYDCKIDETPYNIKITAGHTADNLSSKKGLVYCLTGDENIGVSHQEAIDTISKCYNTEDHDYGLIVLNKEKDKIYISSLKNIDVNLLSPAGSNLPFQIYFGGLDNILNHSVKDQDKKIIECYLKSWEKKITIDLNPLYDIIKRI